MKNYIKRQTTGDWVLKISTLIIPIYYFGFVDANFAAIILFTGGFFGLIMKLSEPQETWFEFITVLSTLIIMIIVIFYKTWNGNM